MVSLPPRGLENYSNVLVFYIFTCYQGLCYKNFLRVEFTSIRSELEYWYLAAISNQVWSETNTGAECLKGASLGYAPALLTGIRLGWNACQGETL